MEAARRAQGPGTAREVFGAALRLGLTSFGGAIAHFGYFRREYVERRRWLDESTFADLLALAQALPGPASSQLGMTIGYRRAGVPGALAAWLGFTLPSAVIMIGFATLTSSVDLANAGWVHGLKMAAVAVVASALVAMWRALAADVPRSVIAILAGALVLAWTSPVAQPATIVVGALVGRLMLGRVPGRLPADRPRDATPSDTLADAPAPTHPRNPHRRRSAIALALFVGLLVGLPALRLVTGSSVAATFDAFYRSGALVFGGGHVVLPLLHATVVDPGWVSDDRFLAGYGLAQAVPGPLFTFAGYLGATSSLPPGGVFGGLIAIVAIFLPSLLLVVGIVPAWDTMRSWAGARAALLGINAAVVGLLAAALIDPVVSSSVHGPVDAAIGLAGAALLVGRVVPPWVVVIAGVAVGQAIG